MFCINNCIEEILMVAEDFIVWKYENLEKETERRLQLVDLVMLELGAVPTESKNGHQVFSYDNKYFYSELENETKIALYSSNSKDNSFVKIKTIAGDTPICIFYDTVQEIFGLVPDDNNTFVPLSKTEHLLAESENFAVTHEFETAFVFNKKNQTFTEIGFFYGEPEYALIDTNEKFCVVAGDIISIFDMQGTELKSLNDIPNEYTYYIKQFGNKIIVRKENVGLMEIDCNDFLPI